MDCKLDKSLLQDLLDGVIDPLERIFVEEHIKTCKECRREMTEMKLLFWDLDNKANYEIEIPEELDRLKDTVIETAAGKVHKSAAGMVMDRQLRTIKTSGNFLAYVPGAKQSGRLIKEGVKAVPGVLGKASGGLLKGAKSLLAK